MLVEQRGQEEQEHQIGVERDAARRRAGQVREAQRQPAEHEQDGVGDVGLARHGHQGDHGYEQDEDERDGIHSLLGPLTLYNRGSALT